jgi:hypothetical protein
MAHLIECCHDGRTHMFRTLFAFFALTAGVMILVGLDRRGDIGPADAQAVALNWVGVGVAQEPRRDGSEWEVDVVRPDGSLVEVTIGKALEARGFDEERGTAGRPAPDEIQGTLRATATRIALAETGPGRALSVEREGTREIEVGIRTRANRSVEVELDAALRVVEVEPEDPRDE